MTKRSSAKPRRYRANVGGREIDLEIGEDNFTIRERGNSAGEMGPTEAKFAYSRARVSDRHISLILNGRSIEAIVRREAGGRYFVQIDGYEFELALKDEKDLLLERFGMAGISAQGLREVRAPMPGLVLSVAVAAGENVSPGQGLVVLEAMKMENELRANASGTVKAIHVSAGDAVGKNDLLVEIED